MPRPTKPRSPASIVPVLVDNHRRFLSFLEKRVGSHENAEEILQAALLKGIEKCASIHEDKSVVAWFYRVLRNALTDHYRRRAAGRKALAARAVKAADAGPDPGLKRVICACMKRLVKVLPPDYAEILQRVDLDGSELAEAAGALEITTGNARVRLHRARQALRRELERSCGTCTEHGCLDCTCASDHERAG